MNLYSYSNSLISRLFTVLDLTKSAESDIEFSNIEKFIDTIAIELQGSLGDFEENKYGNQMTNVLMKIKSIRDIPDYNIRRKFVLDSIEIINRVQSELKQES
jgi:hypothetical protein